MIQELDDYMVGMGAGVRFRANFSVEDQLGRILDAILYSHKAFFSPKVFPNVLGGPGQKTLINEKTGDRLTIDTSNFLLEVRFGNGGFTQKDYPKILESFDSEIIKKVMAKYGVTQIIRVGLVKRYVFPLSKLASAFVDKTIGKTLEGVNDINLSFSKKLPVPEALVKRDVNDWANAIFNVIKKADADEIFMSVDYQLYFVPFLENVNEINFKPFVFSADHFNRHRYLPWLNTNYIEESTNG